MGVSPAPEEVRVPPSGGSLHDGFSRPNSPPHSMEENFHSMEKNFHSMEKLFHSMEE
jgi:hypothetical protein